MKLTIECGESDIITIQEIIKKLGLEKFCTKQCDGNPLCFEFADENGNGTFDLSTGGIEYADSDENNRNYYEDELGSYSLMEALDFSTLVWGVNDGGETVAYYES